VRILTGSVLLLSAACAAPNAAVHDTPATHATALPFIENDYAGALAQAKARGVPVFVDVWAPW
jgi:hypothetical protein